MYIYIYIRKLKYRNVRFFFKAIFKNFRFGYNVWSKSNIYNINNNIKLAYLATTSDPRALDMGLTARSCHKNMITR